MDRTYSDQEFRRELNDRGSDALGDYHLSGRAKAAIVSGDLKWMLEHVGELTQKQLVFIYKPLENEGR